MDADETTRIDALMAEQHPGAYAAPRQDSPPEEKPASVEEVVLAPMVGAKARRSERHQAIVDASGWIAWLIGYRAELNLRLPRTSSQMEDAPRRASLERDRPVRRLH
jgi:hypothetical protein